MEKKSLKELVVRALSAQWQKQMMNGETEWSEQLRLTKRANDARKKIRCTASEILALDGASVGSYYQLKVEQITKVEFEILLREGTKLVTWVYVTVTDEVTK